mmetsp:Transcript_106297/g.299082  ORF Transcript_106297/g.299082 Transcript_106297/m.299082 type:complete len:212 (+) Transcript_106297:107-742(+)
MGHIIYFPATWLRVSEGHCRRDAVRFVVDGLMVVVQRAQSRLEVERRWRPGFLERRHFRPRFLAGLPHADCLFSFLGGRHHSPRDAWHMDERREQPLRLLHDRPRQTRADSGLPAPSRPPHEHDALCGLAGRGGHGRRKFRTHRLRRNQRRTSEVPRYSGRPSLNHHAVGPAAHSEQSKFRRHLDRPADLVACLPRALERYRELPERGEDQ